MTLYQLRPGELGRYNGLRLHTGQPRLAPILDQMFMLAAFHWQMAQQRGDPAESASEKLGRYLLTGKW